MYILSIRYIRCRHEGQCTEIEVTRHIVSCRVVVPLCILPLFIPLYTTQFTTNGIHGRLLLVAYSPFRVSPSPSPRGRVGRSAQCVNNLRIEKAAHYSQRHRIRVLRADRTFKCKEATRAAEDDRLLSRQHERHSKHGDVVR